MTQVTNMKISTDYPPNYRDLFDKFGEDKNTVYCYGDTIYNPHGRNITPDIEIHEQVHSKQQGNNPELWYYNYITSGDFRLKQEIEAYGEQYKFVKPHLTARLKMWAKDNMATALSSKSYGNIITYREAEKAIRNYE